MTLSLIQTQLLPPILPTPILQGQILVQILTQALIQTKNDDHEMVAPVLMGLHAIWDQPQGGGSPFSNPPPLPPRPYSPSPPSPPLSPVKHKPDQSLIKALPKPQVLPSLLHPQPIQVSPKPHPSARQSPHQPQPSKSIYEISTSSNPTAIYNILHLQF